MKGKQGPGQSSAGVDFMGSVVAERLGFKADEALTLGRVLAGLNAQSKGRRFGIFKPVPREVRKVREREHGQEFWVELLGRALPAVNTAEGVRAVVKSKPIEPDAVGRYLENKFGMPLPMVCRSMKVLADAYGRANWQNGASAFTKSSGPVGGKGQLDLGRLSRLALRTR